MTDAAKVIHEANHPLNNRFVPNEAEGMAGSYEQGAFASNHIYLDTGQSTPYDTVDTGDYSYFDVTTKAHVKFTASAATVTLSNPTHHSNFFGLNAGVAIEATDLIYLDENPESIAQLKDGEIIAGLSFNLADIYSFYPGWEGLRGGSTVYDEINDTSTTIAAYTTISRTTLENTNYGACALLFNQDATGRFLSMVNDNTFAVDSSGKYNDTGLKPNLDKMTIMMRASGLLEDLNSSGVGLGTYSQRVEKREHAWDDVALGVELGDISTTIASGGTVDIIAEVATFTSTQATPSGLVIKSLSTIIGNDYLITFKIDTITTGAANLKLWSSPGFPGSLVQITEETVTSPNGKTIEYSFTYNAIHTNMDLYVQMDVGVQIGDTMALSLLSVKELYTEESYRIDDVEQAYIPARPSPTATLKLNELPSIGYQDDITLHHDAHRVVFDFVTIVESQAWDQDYYEQNYALTDENGEAFTDENGDILYILP